MGFKKMVLEVLQNDKKTSSEFKFLPFDPFCSQRVNAKYLIMLLYQKISFYFKIYKFGNFHKL
jgi:hypothetical protein